MLHDRDESRANELIAILSGPYPKRIVRGAADPTGFEVVVNATPMGISPSDPLPVPAHLLSASMFVGDVIAGHDVTPLLMAAREAGCKTADGVAMVEAGIELMQDFLLAQVDSE